MELERGREGVVVHTSRRVGELAVCLGPLTRATLRLSSHAWLIYLHKNVLHIENISLNITFRLKYVEKQIIFVE